MNGSTGLFDASGRRARAYAENSLPVARTSAENYGIAAQAAGAKIDAQQAQLQAAASTTIPQVSPELRSVVQHLWSGDRPAEAFVGVNKDMVLQDAARVLDAIDRRIGPVGPVALTSPDRAKAVGLQRDQAEVVRELRQALMQVQRVGVAQDQVETLREGRGITR